MTPHDYPQKNDNIKNHKSISYITECHLSAMLYSKPVPIYTQECPR